MFVVKVRGRAVKAFLVGGFNVCSCRYEMETHKLLCESLVM